MDRQNNVLMSNQQAPTRKKRHGNRRNQRFRRKCRAEKMNPAKIEKLIQKRNRIQKKNKNSSTRQILSTNSESATLKNEVLPSRETYQSQPIITTKTILSKRKRDISSQYLSSTKDVTIQKTASSISIVQPASKKMKNLSEIINNNSIINTNNNEMNNHINYRYAYTFENFIGTNTDPHISIYTEFI